jgi:NAD(P)-dependent dehydrogenase (short-subunit alcohol dehydrogenase family)
MTRARLAGQVALVTGAASGIGEATARQLAEEGAAIAALDREPSGLERIAAAIRQAGGQATVHVVDLGRIETIPAAVEAVLAAHGRIDCLVNAAGVSGDEGEILTQSEANWDRVLTIDLKAPFRLIQEVGRHMVARGGGGRIVNVTSSSAHRARRVMAPYGAAKAGLAQLTRTAAADLGRYDINVNAVAPGVTRTPMTQGIGDEDEFRKVIAEGPLANLTGRASLPEDVASAIVYLCLPEVARSRGRRSTRARAPSSSRLRTAPHRAARCELQRAFRSETSSGPSIASRATRSGRMVSSAFRASRSPRRAVPSAFSACEPRPMEHGGQGGVAGDGPAEAT